MNHRPLSDLPKEDPKGLTSDLAFLSGGGEMGELIRSKDWSKTPVGPVDRWPQSLKTAVRIMLTSRQPIWIGWGEQLIKLYNDPYKAIVRGKHPAALGQPASVVWREIWPDIEPMLNTAMGGIEGTYVESQLLIMERNGYPEETYYTYSYSPIPDDQGDVGGIFCANTDDTDRVIGERQLALLKDLAARTVHARTFDDACRLSSASLETNRQDFPFALMYLAEPAPNGFVLAATSGLEPNQRAAAGYALDAASVWPLAEVICAQKPSVISGLSRLFDHLPTGAWKQPPHQAIVVPIVPSDKTGKAGVLIAGLNPFRLFDDRYQRFVDLVVGQIAASLANAQRYEEERKRAEALAELDRAKTAFFSNVSHELRTPLTLMLGPLEELKARFGRSTSSLDVSQYQQVDVVHRNGLRLLKLVNQLLDFSRIEAGRAQALYEETDLAAFTADLASVFRSAIEKAGLSLVVDCPPLSEPVYVDRDMWEKIVLNLLSNAFKFTFAGEIEVALRPSGKHVELSIRDTGTGIPEDQLGKIFERFHRVAGSQGRTFEGTGIGLSLVQELARLHGGSVSVDSVYGKGSTFRVFIPLGKSHLPHKHIGVPRRQTSTATGVIPFVEEALHWLPDDNSAEYPVLSAELSDQTGFGSDTQHSSLSTQSSRPRVLLADDNADMRDYVRRLLSSQGYEVESVADGQEALEAVRKRRPDLILTDVMMPRLDGFGLLRELRADIGTKTIPVILLSARAGEESRVEGLERGADDYLIKPFSARELLARVSAHLDMARVRREAEERVTTILESLTDGCHVIDDAGRFAYFNRAARDMYAEQGIDADTLIGKQVSEAFPDARELPATRALQRTLAERVPTEAENFYTPWRRWFAVRHYPTADGGVSTFFQDITDRKRNEVLLNEQKQLLEFIATGWQLDECLNALTDAVSRLQPNARAAVLMANADQSAMADCHAARLQPTFGAGIAGAPINDLAIGTCGTAIFTGEPVTCSDIAGSDSWSQPWRELCMAHGIRACHSTPVFSPEGKAVASFFLCFSEAREPDAWDRRIAEFGRYVVCIAIERNRGEKALRESEQETKRARDYAEATLRISPVPLLVLEKDFRVNTANEAFYETFQVDTAETQGRLVYELGNGQWNIPKLRELLETILPQRTVFKGFEVTHDFELVGRRTMLLNARQMDNEPDIPERIVLVIEDITDRKAAEEALRESEARFRTLADNMSQFAWMADAAGWIFWYNRRWYEYTGTTLEQMQGWGWKAVHHPDHVDRVVDRIQRSWDTGDLWEDTFPLRGQDGVYRWFLSRAVPIRDSAGRVIRWFGTNTDITELRDMEADLQESEQKLRSLADRLEQRVAERTYELAKSEDHLRTLATELNLAEQRERKRLATELHDHLQQLLVLGRLTIGQGKRVAAAVPAVEQILKKVDDIFSDSLTYTRTLVSDLSPTVLRDHGLAVALQWLGAYMQKYHQTVTVTVPDDAGLKLPENQVILLFQSVRELLINSSKHAGTGEATVRMEQCDDRLRIDVSDEGAGFDLAAAAAAAAGTPSGGISSKFGLFSIRERMRALGGSFEIESAPGKGTTATLMLPLGGGAAARTEDSGLRTELSGKNSALSTQDSALPGHSALPNRSALRTSFDRLRTPSTVEGQHSALHEKPRIRVLLVDDHPMMRQGLRSIVTAYDHLEVVGEAGDGAEAVELAQRLVPDVVVMDINMPKMNGIEATRQIKANQPTTVVIGLSVNQSADTERKMTAAGASAYLTKENAADALCHAIEQAMSYKQHQAARPVD